MGNIQIEKLFCFLLSNLPLPSPIILENGYSKHLQNSMETTRLVLVLVAGHRPSYLHKLNCAACCPSNFEVVTYWDVFH